MNKTSGRNKSFPVVAIGASASGLEAYSELFRSLPADTGMAFVLIQHLDPSHESMLRDIIAKTTKMQVEEVRADAKIRPNRVYVIPPNSLMSIADGTFALTARSKQQGPHLSVNFFMRSLAEERKSKAIGVILSGTGSDGTLGLSAIRAEGGINFSQDLESSKYDGMPRSAIASGFVDFVLPPREIARELTRIVRHSFVKQSEVEDVHAPEPERPPPATGDFNHILELLRKSHGVDFRQYKPSTIHRRIQRRMAILRLNSLAEYAGRLKNNAGEAQLLFDDILIPVTSFFRDMEAFDLLKSHVYPAITKGKTNGPIRMWAPGCSTGEETYSLAMTLLEFLDDRAANFQIQLFGTDLNEKGIQHARSGIYAEAIADEISPDRLRRFFAKEEGGYRVTKAVRDLCVFARQDLASDPPFSQMNLVACRNMLIYLSPALQRKVMPILHYSLVRDGFLFLGNAESASAYSNLFSQVDKKNKIYAKKPTVSRLHYDFAQAYYPREKGAEPARKATSAREPERELNIEVEADRAVLSNYGPAGVVVNNSFEVVQFRGRTANYLESAPGKPTVNLLKLAKNGLASELRVLLNAAKKRNEPARKNNVRFDDAAHKRLVNLQVSLLGGNKSSPEARHFLVLFEEVSPQATSKAGKVGAKAGRANSNDRQLERVRTELASTRDSLRAAMESEEATREEFQSANEEVLSANEELQSTNEELETSKEELQSANEELNTLNDELRNANAELTLLGNDISNFLNSAKIPIIMVDTSFRIRRFTTTAGAMLNVAASDVGRPVTDIRLNVRVQDWERMLSQVMDGLQPLEREVQDEQDRWHSLHIQPYRTIDHKIDGLVLSLQNIDPMKRSNEQLRNSTQFLQGIVDTVRQPLLVLDSDLRIISTNESFLQDFQLTRESTINKFLYRIADEQWNIPKLRSVLESVLGNKKEVVDFEVQHEFKELGPRTLLLNAKKLFQRENKEALILLAIEDVSGRRLADSALIAAEKRAAAGQMASQLAHEINNPLQAVTNLITLLKDSSELSSSDQAYVALTEQELSRVIELVRQNLYKQFE